VTQHLTELDSFHLENDQLLRTQLLVDGVWRDGAAGKTFAVTNPATQGVLARVSSAGVEDVRAAIDAADQAFPVWRAVSPDERSRVLRQTAVLLRAHRDDLSLIMTLEMGKPLSESQSEVEISARWFDWFAEEAKRINGEVVSTSISSARFFTVRQPVGVAALITPWNSPIFSIARKAAPALAAGCTTVLKPSEETPLSALALGVLIQSTGLPTGVLNILPTIDAAEVGKEITRSPHVRKLSFTGSTAVGRLLMEQSAPHIRNLSLELGGNSPLLVFDDANIDRAVDGAMASKFAYSGQRCVANNRILVQDSVYEAFLDRLAERVTALTVGAGTDPGNTIGPLIHPRAARAVENLVADATARGARVVAGGRPSGLGPAFVTPTVIADATADMACARSEIFGPVAAVYRFKEEQEAVAVANDTEYGLAAYVFTENIGRAWRVAEALDHGTVLINTGAWTTEHIAFGGLKQSGIGREGGSSGIDEYLETKAIRLEL